MAKDRRKVQHIHSSVFDKQPTPESLEMGELAVNNNKNGSFISTKNNDGNVVRFSEDATIVDWMEYKEVFPYSAEVSYTEQDLAENKSQLLFKLNQVVGSNTVHADDVNLQTDMHGNVINPISEDGTHDGAGFAVNMNAYVMQGSNPSFSSITTTCGAQFNGTTKINGSSGACGSLLDVDVESITAYASGDTIITSSGATEISGNSINLSAVDSICEASENSATLYGSIMTNVGINCDDTDTATTTTIKGGTTIVHASDGNLGLTASGNILESSENDIIITADNDICETCGKDAVFYGVNSTNIGLSCDCSEASNNVNINSSSATTITSPSVNVNGVLDVAASGMSTTLSWSYGSVNGVRADSTNFKSDKSIVIPSSLEHLEEWNNDCLTIKNNLCVTGMITVTGGVFSTSDERKKEDIEFIDNNSKLKVRNIPLKSFNFKDDNTKRKVYGIIAQEVEKAGLDELVYTDEGGNKSVDYTSFLILRIAYLENMIGHFHSKIAALEKLVNEKK